ncbi:NAD(P)-dependent oxidoreductase, partial [Rhodopseudomonas sp. BR0C11]|nr:NAD(P)-dependent oxidoreductase [Rhodopseudomonas sp. BR0C11]
ITGQTLVIDGGLSLGEPFGVARATFRAAAGAA